MLPRMSANGSNAPVPHRLATALLLLVSLVVGLGACGDETTIQGTGYDGPPHAEPPAVRAEGGPDQAFIEARVTRTVFLTGAILGKYKPCGCTAPQVGGIERLAGLVDILEKRAEKGVVGLALGWNLANNYEAQQEAKSGLLRAAYAALGFKGVLLGGSDLREGAMTTPYATDSGNPLDTPTPPINVVLPPRNPAQTTSPRLHVQALDLKINAMAVLDKREGDALKSEGVLIQALPPTAPFSGMLQPDPTALWIVACRFDEKADVEALVAAVGRLGPAVVVDLSGVAGQDQVGPRAFGPDMKPLLVHIEDKGKATGVLDFRTDAAGATTLSYRSIRLVPELQERETEYRQEIADLIEYYKEDVFEGQYLKDFPTMREPGSATYVGSTMCVKCHEQIFRDWTQTPHASAIPTLKETHHEWDPECIRCHVVGWYRESGSGNWARFASGFRDVESTPHLGGVGCENCHGPGSAHVRDPKAAPMFHPTGNDADAQWINKRCSKCHDADNSHGFLHNPESYLFRINHGNVPSDRRTQVPADWKPPPPPKKGPGK